jgi:hemolysin III
MSYPYPKREVIADGVIHVLGLIAAITGTVILLVWAATHSVGSNIAAVSVYAGFLLFALFASAAYHLLPWERSRPVLHRIDHAAIYLKIAGTYTPFVVLIGSAFAYVVLIGLWIVALVGAVAKLSFWQANGRGSLALYLLMGWACILLVGPMFQTLPTPALWLIFIGGGLYTLGTVFFSLESLPFHNAIWHGFVLVASTCFFVAVAVSLAQSV